MKFIEIMQGKWLGHPLHPAIVHVPIGAWMAACALDLISKTGWIPVAGAERLALYCVGGGLIGALIAMPFGIADWLPIKKGKPARKLGIYHLLVNLLATIVWAVNFFQRLEVGGVFSTGAILTTSILGTLLVLVGGFLGSLLVLDHGVSVARHSKSEWRSRASQGGARLPKES